MSSTSSYCIPKAREPDNKLNSEHDIIMMPAGGSANLGSFVIGRQGTCQKKQTLTCHTLFHALWACCNIIQHDIGAY